MGCDIHAHFEIKLNGKWEHYSHPRIKRRYGLFTKIAGVRNCGDEIEPISEPKGLPDALSVVTRFEADRIGPDGHSHTWLDAEELATMMEWTDDNAADGEKWRFELEELGYCCGNGWDSFKKHAEDWPFDIEDIRFVCWFDN